MNWTDAQIALMQALVYSVEAGEHADAGRTADACKCEAMATELSRKAHVLPADHPANRQVFTAKS